MKKYIAIISSLILLSCLESSEDRIVRKLSFELDSRGLEIDTVITINATEILVSPKDYKKERLTVYLYDFIKVKNEDSLETLLEQQADRIQAWFELPEWDNESDVFSPWLTSRLKDPEIYKQKHTENYALIFNHTNTETHKMTSVGKRLLGHWKMTEKEFEKWAKDYLNTRYKKEAQLIKTPHKDLELFQLKCPWNQQLSYGLIFTENFKNEASDKIGYPFHVLLNGNFPVYISKKGDLKVLKKSIEEMESRIKQRDILPTELITYTRNGIEISEIK